MNRALNAFRAGVCCIVLAFLSIVSLVGCGSSGSDTTDSSAPPWVAVSSTNSGTVEVSLAGTAWVNNDYYASHCVGLGCLIDTQRTDDFPGVTVTWQNLTTATSGTAISYYGPGTSWQHQWSASVPLTSGANTIEISARDPSGKGGAVTVMVIQKPPISVLSTSPLDGSVGVFPNTVVSATFSEAIDPYRSFFTVQGPAGTVPGVRAVNGSAVTFTPNSLLAYGSTYTVTLPTTIRSQTGASLAADYTWTFTTMDAPLFSVVSTAPANKATGVTTNLWSISATFNRDIDLNSVFNKFVVTGPTGTVPGTLRLYKATITFDLAGTLAANATYTATLKAGIRDTSGNTLPFDHTWTFTTGE